MEQEKQGLEQVEEKKEALVQEEKKDEKKEEKEEAQEEQDEADEKEKLDELKNALAQMQMGQPSQKPPANPEKYEQTTQNHHMVSDTPLNTEVEGVIDATHHFRRTTRTADQPLQL